MTYYLAVIGDIIQSKQVENRNQLQISIHEAFNKVDEQFPNIIQSKFTLTLGDEFQALLKPSTQVFELLDYLASLVPVPFRYGLGYGTLNTTFDPNISIGADGPAYWNAREAINIIHEQNWSGKTSGYFMSKDITLDRTINNLILLSDTLKNEWTTLQKETFDAMLTQKIYTDDFNQKEFAKSIGISESSLSKRLNSGNIKIYLYTRNTLGYLLEVYDESSKS